MNLASLNISPKVRIHEGQKQIFDKIRKKYVCLTPEEWVRQLVIHFLNEELAYPVSLMSIEKSVSYNGLKKRFDIMASDYCGNPRLLVECKSAEAGISEETFRQAAVYNFALKAEYLIITDGLTTYCAKMNFLENSWVFVQEIPPFEPGCKVD